jgi:hypothetical protein
MGRTPKVPKAKKMATPGSYRLEASKKSGEKRTNQKSGKKKVKRASSGGNTPKPGRPSTKRKGTARKDNYR